MENIGSELCNKFHIRAKSVLGGKVHTKIADSVWHEVSIRIWRPLSDNQGQDAVMVGRQSIKLRDYKK